MKNLIILAALLVSFVANAQTAGIALQAGGTNELGTVFNTSAGSTLFASVNFTGQSERTWSGVLAVTNTPSANATLQVVLSGTTNSYTWQTTPVTNVQTLSVSAPLARIGVESTPNAGDTLTIIRSAYGSIATNAYTNVLTWATNVDAQTKILIGASAAASTTNLYNALRYYGWNLSIPTIGYYKAAGLELRGAPNETWYVTNSSTWATNINSTYYTVTNTATTNSYQIAIGANTRVSATNLYAKLVSDYGTNLVLSYADTNSINIASPQAQGLAVTAATAWGSCVIASNSILGVVTLISSNSVNGNQWFRATNDITIAFSTTNAVAVQTNWNGFAWPFLKYTVQNPQTNYGAARGLNVSVGVK